MSTLRRGDQIKPYPYFIIKPLGVDEGNMSEVYLAQTLTPALTTRATPLRRQQSTAMFEQKVVIKIARVQEADGAALTPDDSYFNTDALRKEESRLRRLNHPAIVQLLPIRDKDNRSIGTLARSQLEHQPWFAVLEYLAGASLLAHLERIKAEHGGKARGLDLNLALGITYILAGALDYLHHTGKPQVDSGASAPTVHVGVAHLDVKPANILFRREPRPGHRPEPVLVDFGITGDIGRSALEAGTLAYMAPERVLGTVPYPTTKMDIYSLGLVLYEMVTGINPFQREDEVATAAAIVAGNPPKPSSVPHMQNGSLLSRLDTLILRMLDREPENRPELEIVGREVKALLIEGGQPTLWPEESNVERSSGKSPGGRRWQRIVWRLIQALLLLGLGALLAYMFFILNPRVNGPEASQIAADAAITVAPTVTPLPPATSTAASLPSPTPTVTPQPSPTATLSPTLTSTPTVTPPPPDFGAAGIPDLEVVLVSPGKNAEGQIQNFVWKVVKGSLPEGYEFEVIFWRSGGDPMTRDGFGLATPSQAKNIENGEYLLENINLVQLDYELGDLLNPGEFVWGVRLIQQGCNAAWCRVKVFSDGRTFNFKYAQ